MTVVQEEVCCGVGSVAPFVVEEAGSRVVEGSAVLISDELVFEVVYD